MYLHSYSTVCFLHCQAHRILIRHLEISMLNTSSRTPVKEANRLLVTLSPFASLRVNSAKGLDRWVQRCFAALSMTGVGKTITSPLLTHKIATTLCRLYLSFALSVPEFCASGLLVFF